jgi:nitroreductase
MGSPLEVEKDIREFLNVHREDWRLVCGLTLGYPNHEPPVPQRATEGRIVFLENGDT